MDLNTWKREAERSQHELAEQLGDRIWDEFTIPVDEQFLSQKIAYAFFGPPSDVGSGYSKDKLDTILELTNKCLERKIVDKVDLAFIFLFAYNSLDSGNQSIPLIRLRKIDEVITRNSYFIDHCGRVYTNWPDFLDDNIFNGYWVCAPKDGLYSFDEDNYGIEFIDQSTRGQILEICDTVSTVTNVVGSIGIAAGVAMTFCPLTAPVGGLVLAASSIVSAPGAVYATGRAIGKLVDRGQHDQTLSLADSEARACWINIAASAISVGVMGSTKVLTSIARAGRVANSGTRALCTALGVTNISVSGIGIINSVVELSQKETVTPLDVLQLTTSTLFFTHSVVSFKTASSIIKTTQDKIIASKRQLLPEENKQNFDVMLKARKEMVTPGKIREMHGNAVFIRKLRELQNIEEYFNAFNLTRDHQLNFHNELILEPKAFLQMNDQQTKTVIELSNQLRSKQIDRAAFNERLAPICREYRLILEQQKTEATSKLCRSFGTNDLTEIDMFKGIKDHEIVRLDQVFRNTGKNYDQKFITACQIIARQMECKNPSEFAAIAEYISTKINDKVTADMKTDSNPVRAVGKAKPFYYNKYLDDYINNENAQRELLGQFREIEQVCDRANTSGNPQFANSKTATYHYEKHKFLPKVDEKNNLSPERYFEIARELVGGKIQNTKWTQDGHCLVLEFKSNEYSAKAIKYINLADNKSVIATMMRDNGKQVNRLYGN